MGRGGKVSGKRNFKKRARSEEGSSDDSDDDYVLSDEGRDESDCLDDDYCSSLDECASEECFDDFVEEEDEGEEEIQPARKFNRSKAKHGLCEQQNNASKTTRKRGRIIHAEQPELEQDGDGDEGEDRDEDFNYDEDDGEFTPEEEDYSDEEEERVGGKKKNNGMKTGKKVSQRRVSKASTRPRKRRTTRASKKPLRKKRRRVGGLRRKVRCDDVDDFIDDGSAIKTKSRKNSGRKRRRLDPEDSYSDSDCVSFGPSDYGLSISEEEREQVREAKELCGRLRRNLRRSSLLLKNEEAGVHDDLQQQQKPPGQKGKEKIQEPQGRKGKEKEVRKQVCGICLSEENKRRVRGVLDCCTHYFCYACIMEWAKVESRCPLCKQRFKTVSKPARTLRGLDLREVVVQVPERDQVYQPSEEELMSYMDPYEYVICSECYQGGDDGLMLLCDICDSPAHTYCVGLGREVPEGNWYCHGCRPVALASSTSSQVLQDQVADRRVTPQTLPVRPSPVLHVQESMDFNLTSSPGTSFSQGFGLIPPSRFSGRSVEGASLVSGGGQPTLSDRRRRIDHQIHQLLSLDRMTSPGIANGISTTSSAINLHPSQIDQSTRTQDVGTSYQTFFEESLWDNSTSPLMQNGDPFSMRISNLRRPTVQDSIIFANRSMNGVLWSGFVEAPSSISDYEPGHQFSSRSNTVPDGSLSPAIKEEEGNFHIVKEQLQSMVKTHLEALSRDIDLGTSTFNDIARSSTHTILAACGLEHKKSEVCCNVPPPSVCSHIELMAGEQTSLIKGCCSSCFESFVGEVVKVILNTRMSPQWLRLGR